MVKLNKLSLGDVLLKRGSLTEKDVKKATEHCRNNGDSFAETVVKMGLVTEEEVAQGLAEKYGIPYIRNNYQLDPKVTKIVPETLARKYKVVPLSLSGNILTLATADPLNVLAFDDVKFATGYRTRCVLSTPVEIKKTINNFYLSKPLKNCLYPGKNNNRKN